MRRLMDGARQDPFAVLGHHPQETGELVRVLLPRAVEARLIDLEAPMERVGDSPFFEWRGPGGRVPQRYRIGWRDADGGEHTAYDPYCFPPQVGELDLDLFGQGRHWQIYRVLGAHPRELDGIPGVLFATWAPNAERVSVVGDFNGWDGHRHPMRPRDGPGVWELFIPGVSAGALYNFALQPWGGGPCQVKIDPYGRRFEGRPATAALVTPDSTYRWRDADWMAGHREWDWQHSPISVYEVHLGSWRRDEHRRVLGYRKLADELVVYVSTLGFTHIELLPVTEHPRDASWGYQTTGYYAPTSRFGSPDDFRYFVDHCHHHGIGVILDWVPGHFPKDAHALARFDGTALYEHEDPRQGEPCERGTLVFNYGRNEVKNFLLANALFWLDEFHLDGLRVDAVASMLYLDHSRKSGEWIPNEYGGNENLEAIAFLRDLNELTHQRHPGTLTVAEEATAWPQVTRPTWVGGLGFNMKWNMGWMHDTLEYMSKDPIFRHYHHDLLTFGLLYAFSENFLLPLSHDEVAHLKYSLLEKMPGDDWQRLANLRLLYTCMWTYPGKKLLFMGGEFAQGRKWNHAEALDWHLLDQPAHRGAQALVSDLNHLYETVPALHAHDFESQGFEWIDCHDAPQSTISFVRRHGNDVLVVVLNFTPVTRHDYRIGVPLPGVYREVLNSDSEYYGGSNVGNGGDLKAQPRPWMGRRHSLNVTLPPLGGVVFRPEGAAR
jgi:1,4-alpha-glucan branching enzyme